MSSGPRQVGYVGPVLKADARSAALTLCEIAMKKHKKRADAKLAAEETIEAVLGRDYMIEELGAQEIE